MADAKAAAAGSEKQSEGTTRRSRGGSVAVPVADPVPGIAKPSSSPLPDQEFTSFPISCTVIMI